MFQLFVSYIRAEHNLPQEHLIIPIKILGKNNCVPTSRELKHIEQSINDVHCKIWDDWLACQRFQDLNTICLQIFQHEMSHCHKQIKEGVGFLKLFCYCVTIHHIMSGDVRLVQQLLFQLFMLIKKQWSFHRLTTLRMKSFIGQPNPPLNGWLLLN